MVQITQITSFSTSHRWCKLRRLRELFQFNSIPVIPVISPKGSCSKTQIHVVKHLFLFAHTAHTQYLCLRISTMVDSRRSGRVFHVVNCSQISILGGSCLAPSFLVNVFHDYSVILTQTELEWDNPVLPYTSQWKQQDHHPLCTL